MSSEITIDATAYASILASLLIAVMGTQALTIVKSWRDLAEAQKRSDEDRAQIATMAASIASLNNRFNSLPVELRINTNAGQEDQFSDGHKKPKPELAQVQIEKNTRRD